MLLFSEDDQTAIYIVITKNFSSDAQILDTADNPFLIKEKSSLSTTDKIDEIPAKNPIALELL